MSLRLFKRIDKHQNLTVGAVYDEYKPNYIRDNNGHAYHLSKPPVGGKNDHWEDVTNSPPAAIQENNMLTIKKTTLINGNDCDDLDLEHILALIDEEQKSIDRITSTLAGSKSLTKLTKSAKENIVALIKIIDARPVQ